VGGRHGLPARRADPAGAARAPRPRQLRLPAVRRSSWPGSGRDVERLAERFGWAVAPEAVHPLAGIIPGLFLGTLATTGPGEQVVVQPPIYPPFFTAIRQTGRVVLENPMVDDGARFVMDLDQLRAAITPATRAIMFCNPHNPTGRVFDRAELEALAEVVLEHRLWVISDELHADLVFDGRHVPFASLSPEVAQRTLTLYGPTKAFNLAGFKIGFLIAENPALLARAKEIAGYFLPGVNVMGQIAALAAFREGDAWLGAALGYLRANRDHLLARLAAEAPAVRAYAPEGTYLVWLDFRATGLGDDPAAVLLERGRVGLNAGPTTAPAARASRASTSPPRGDPRRRHRPAGGDGRLEAGGASSATGRIESSPPCSWLWRPEWVPHGCRTARAVRATGVSRDHWTR
jgi:cysteine-S-conjugate beta-lyase